MVKMVKNAAILFLVCCVMVSAKTVETSALSRTKRTTNCENVKKIFQFRNITMTGGKNKGRVCGGECCGDEDEDLLRKQGQRDFATLLRHNSRSVQGLLSFTAATLQNHVSDLSRQSENKTLLLLSQVYKSQAVLSKDPIGRLYSDIRNYVLINTTSKDLGSTNINLKESVAQFFRDFFPLVYHHILLINGSKDFTHDYKTCLKKTTETIQPFGDIPNRISEALSEGLKATRLLLQAFGIGIEVLNTTDRLLVDENGKNNAECHEALLKMNYCPKCLGLVKHAKPCSGYCLNVLRGCLTKYVVELDSPWNGYVEGIESLIHVMKKNNKEMVGVSADNVIRSIDQRISEALMTAIQKGKDINAKVQRSCGPATFSTRKDPRTAELSTPMPTTKPRVYGTMPEEQLSHFLASIAKTKGFYSTLADTLCKDESFAEPKDQRCWNGERIAEYTKTVVDVSLNMQKYNPEVKPTTNLHETDHRVADLADKLRHVHQMAMTSIGPTLAEVDYMQRDGVEGSGSGNGADIDDGDDDPVTGNGSGSGHGPDTGVEDGRNISPVDSPNGKRTDGKQKPHSPTGKGSSVQPSLLISLVLVAILRLN